MWWIAALRAARKKWWFIFCGGCSYYTMKCNGMVELRIKRRLPGWRSQNGEPLRKSGIITASRLGQRGQRKRAGHGAAAGFPYGQRRACGCSHGSFRPTRLWFSRCFGRRLRQRLTCLFPGSQCRCCSGKWLWVSPPGSQNCRIFFLPSSIKENGNAYQSEEKTVKKNRCCMVC